MQKSYNSAAGPDEVLYNLLTHLPESVLWVCLFVCLFVAVVVIVVVVVFFKYIIVFRNPELSLSSLKEAIVVPIAKAGKDPKNPTNYRTIALTS